MKKTLALLFAALLLVSATACGGNEDPQDTTADTGLSLPQGTGEASTVEAVTDAQGNVVTNPQETNAPDNVSEENPTFTDCNLSLYVWVETSANVRSSTTLNTDDNKIGTVMNGDILTATGESDNWYRIKFTPKDGEEVDAYIAKTVAGDKAILDTFEDVENQEIEISANVNVRTFPSAAGGDYTYVTTLEKGTKVTRVAIGDGWSRILYEVVSETETDTAGNPVKEFKQYYIINDCIVGEDSTEAATEAATEASTEEVKA